MKVSKFNIAKPEKYTKDNEEKTYWANVGTMTVFQKDDGTVSRIMEIPAIGLKANIFPFEKKEDKPKQSTPDTEVIDVDSIPF